MRDAGIAAIILAAGASSRMSVLNKGVIKKEYQKLSSGITVLESAVSAFSSVPSVSVIVIAVPVNGENTARGALSSGFLSSLKQEIIFVNGGQTRRTSAFNALSALVSHNVSYALIHDGARPWVSALLVENIIAAVKKYDAVIPLLPVTDTPKELRITGGGQADFIERHLKRAGVGTAQTPQAFRFPEILHAHEKAALVNDEEFTDDAEIWGRFCGRVAVIPGDPANKKITFPEDLS